MIWWELSPWYEALGTKTWNELSWESSGWVVRGEERCMGASSTSVASISVMLFPINHEMLKIMQYKWI
jgi:hypothetical protein